LNNQRSNATLVSVNIQISDLWDCWQACYQLIYATSLRLIGISSFIEHFYILKFILLGVKIQRAERVKHVLQAC
jgi:hypothetical protein